MNATTPPTPHTVGILAGMGPAAGVDFARLFVAAKGLLRELGQFVAIAGVQEFGLGLNAVAARLLVEQPGLQQRKCAELALARRHCAIVMCHR